MHHSNVNSWRGRASVFAATFVALMLVAFGLSGLMSQAGAAPVTLTFNSGQMSLGGVIANRVILPATSSFPSDMLPLPQRTDIGLNGTQDGNNISFPTASNTGVQFPYMNFANPLNPQQKVPFTFRLKGPGLSGTFDQATGEAHLAGTIDLIIVTGTGATFPIPDGFVDAATPPLNLFARCAIHDLPIQLSTETKAPFTAQRYTGGLNGTGSMTASWENVPAAVSENGVAQNNSDCATLDSTIHYMGGLWLAKGIAEPPAQPVVTPTCAEDYRQCPKPTFHEITDVTLSPKRKTVKAGKKAKLTARVTNTGNEPAEGTVLKFKSSNRNVKVPASKTVTIPADTTMPVTFKVTVKGKAKGSANIRVKAGEWTADTKVKVKAKKKKHTKKHR